MKRLGICCLVSLAMLIKPLSGAELVTDEDLARARLLFEYSASQFKRVRLGYAVLVEDAQFVTFLTAFGSKNAAATSTFTTSPDFDFTIVSPVILPFNTSFSAATPASGNVAPVTVPNHPRIVFLDGLGNTLNSLDLLTFSDRKQVVVPSTVGPIGVRPTATGEPHEVWVANGGLQVTVADLTSQNVVTNIATPSIPPAGAPAGIVFTNDGNTALEGVKFFSADASGNTGALLVFDAATRKLTSTLLMKFAPTAILISPEGFTAYLLDESGRLMYYDVLSGTADLTVSTFTPGLAVPGYPGASSRVYIHPDGTRLFWESGGLVVFDLTTHKITNYFRSGLPTTLATSFTMSQDGAQVYISNATSSVVVMSTLDGRVIDTFTAPSSTVVLGGPPQ